MHTAYYADEIRDFDPDPEGRLAASESRRAAYPAHEVQAEAVGAVYIPKPVQLDDLLLKLKARFAIARQPSPAPHHIWFLSVGEAAFIHKHSPLICVCDFLRWRIMRKHASL
jgi:hypothetical protein